ncbi:hypothetical protein BH09MYX1_BH09MYX1_36920 [soil metagenome]
MYHPGIMTAVVPTRGVAVELTLSSGEVLSMMVHLGESTRCHDGEETLCDFLETEREFLPAHDDNDELRLIRRDALVMVRPKLNVPEKIRHDSGGIAAVDLVRVELAKGFPRVVGVLDIEPDHKDARLSDLVNGRERFFVMQDEGGVVFVHKLHVLTIGV